jgi:hypothetical protein
MSSGGMAAANFHLRRMQGFAPPRDPPNGRLRGGVAYRRRLRELKASRPGGPPGGKIVAPLRRHPTDNVPAEQGDQAMKRNPNHFGALSGYGQIYFQLEQYEKAIREGDQLLEARAEGESQPGRGRQHRDRRETAGRAAAEHDLAEQPNSKAGA